MYSTPHGAAIGRQSAQRGQIEALAGACVSIPVLRVQIGPDNIDAAECISFRVKPNAPSRSLRPAHLLPLGGDHTRPAPTSKTAQLGAVFTARRYDVRAAVGTTHLRRELYVLVDATGSMGALLAPLKGKLGGLLHQSPFNRFALGYYRDERDGYNAGFTAVRTMDGKPWQVAHGLGRVVFDRGGDHDESALHALDAVARDADGAARWTPGSLRAVLWLGDAASHEPSCANGRKITRQTASQKLRDANVHVLAVDLARGKRGMNAPPVAYGCAKRSRRFASAGQALFIAKRTGGKMLAASPWSIGNVVRKALRKVPLHVVADASHCKRYLKVENVGVRGGLAVGDGKKTVRATILMTNKACAKRKGFSCVVRFLTGGALVGELPVDVSRVRGCWGWGK